MALFILEKGKGGKANILLYFVIYLFFYDEEQRATLLLEDVWNESGLKAGHQNVLPVHTYAL